jgi:hypothetical protein
VFWISSCLSRERFDKRRELFDTAHEVRDLVFKAFPPAVSVGAGTKAEITLDVVIGGFRQLLAAFVEPEPTAPPIVGGIRHKDPERHNADAECGAYLLVDEITATCMKTMGHENRTPDVLAR